MFFTVQQLTKLNGIKLFIRIKDKMILPNKFLEKAQNARKGGRVRSRSRAAPHRAERRGSFTSTFITLTDIQSFKALVLLRLDNIRVRSSLPRKTTGKIINASVENTLMLNLQMSASLRCGRRVFDPRRQRRPEASVGMNTSAGDCLWTVSHADPTSLT